MACVLSKKIGRAALVTALVTVLAFGSAGIFFAESSYAVGETGQETTASQPQTGSNSSNGQTQAAQSTAQNTQSAPSKPQTSSAESTESGKKKVTAGGAIVYCENTGETVFSQNADGRYQPYSITKLLTVLLAVNKLNLEEEVTISKEAASQQGSVAGLKEGEKVKVEDLIYAALLPSGNDAAYALGEAVSGDMDSFVKLMNQTAANIGCANTHFVNCTGMPADGQYTTCSDFLKITRSALSNETVVKAAGTKTYTIKKTNLSPERKLTTKVTLLKDAESGVTAGKTGFGSESDATMVVQYQKSGLMLYVILLGDQSSARTGDLTTLTEYARNTVKGELAVKKGSEQGTVHVKRGARTKARVYAQTDGYAYLPKEGSKKLIQTKVVFNDDVQAPLHRGSVVGQCEIYVGSQKVNSVPLVVQEEIPTGWLPSYVGISNLMTVTILGVLLLLLILFLILLSIRARNRRIRRQQRERKLRSMAIQKMMEEEEKKRRGWDF